MPFTLHLQIFFTTDIFHYILIPFTFQFHYISIYLTFYSCFFCFTFPYNRNILSVSFCFFWVHLLQFHLHLHGNVAILYFCTVVQYMTCGVSPYHYFHPNTQILTPLLTLVDYVVCSTNSPTISNPTPNIRGVAKLTMINQLILTIIIQIIHDISDPLDSYYHQNLGKKGRLKGAGLSLP